MVIDKLFQILIDVAVDMKKTTLITLISIFQLFLINTPPVYSQNLFKPAIIVNDNIISNYELEQRAMLLSLLQVTGDLKKNSSDQLIKEKLLTEFADLTDLKISDEEVEKELESLASRFELSKSQFLIETEKLGISSLTIKEFIKNQKLLRAIIQYKFSSRADISDNEIDSYIMNGSATLEVKLAEIVLPFDYSNKLEVSNLGESLVNRISESITFEEAAIQFSKSVTAKDGGNIGWIAIENIPQELQTRFVTSKPGSILGPEIYQNAVVIYKYFGSREVPLFNNTSIILDFIQIKSSSGSSTEFRNILPIFERNNNCLNLEFELENIENNTFKIDRQKLKTEDLSEEQKDTLNNLDAGESKLSVLDSETNESSLFMLCSREQSISNSDRELARNYLISQRLNFLADGFLADLRSDAKIVFK